MDHEVASIIVQTQPVDNSAMALDNDSANVCTEEELPPSSPTQNAEVDEEKQSINDHYGHQIGFYSTLSLILNAGLMIYAQVGLSGVVLSSLDPNIAIIPSQESINNNTSTTSNNSTEEKCNEQDNQIWQTNNGETTLPSQTDYCSRSYNNIGCLANTTCIQDCFQTLYNYSISCSTCFANILPCGISIGCTFICLADGTTVECYNCLVDCRDEFYGCSGFDMNVASGGIGSSMVVVDEEDDKVSTTADGSTNEAIPLTTSAAASTTSNTCPQYNPSSVSEWYNVYNITYGQSISDAWNGGAEFLAILIILFSGIWPYVKNIILVIVWYVPMTVHRQYSILLWLSRLSKYTLVDVFAVIGILVGVQITLSIGSITFVSRAEPRFAIIAFFLATAWEFVQIEIIKIMHERMVLVSDRRRENDNNDIQDDADRSSKKSVIFSHLWIPAFISFASVCLYVYGALMELVYIKSESNGCIKSYNLVSLGNALVNDLSLTDNEAAGMTWFLYIVYVTLVLALPILAHLLQLFYIAGGAKSKTLIKYISAISCFASVEVLLIGTLGIESKFEEFISSIAGDENAGFIDLKSGLGSGFFILIAYCVVAGFLQFKMESLVVPKVS